MARERVRRHEAKELSGKTPQNQESNFSISKEFKELVLQRKEN